MRSARRSRGCRRSSATISPPPRAGGSRARRSARRSARSRGRRDRDRPELLGPTGFAFVRGDAEAGAPCRGCARAARRGSGHRDLPPRDRGADVIDASRAEEGRRRRGMADKNILHMMTPLAHMSPFDVNMALDAGYDATASYTDVSLERGHGLVQDAIFSRPPKRRRCKTGVFIGGKDAIARARHARRGEAGDGASRS